MYKEFTCPKCESHYFGISRGVGHCHGDFCNFHWMEEDNDKYFKVPDYEILKEICDLLKCNKDNVINKLKSIISK